MQLELTDDEAVIIRQALHVRHTTITVEASHLSVSRSPATIARGQQEQAAIMDLLSRLPA